MNLIPRNVTIYFTHGHGNIFRSKVEIQIVYYGHSQDCTWASMDRYGLILIAIVNLISIPILIDQKKPFQSSQNKWISFDMILVLKQIIFTQHETWKITVPCCAFYSCCAFFKNIFLLHVFSSVLINSVVIKIRRIMEAIN